MPAGGSFGIYGPDGAYPDCCVQHLFERQAAKTPDATALIDQKTHYTYSEFDILTNQLAHYLRSMGVGPEVVVGCCLGRSSAIVLYILAILKAGGAYLLLDPHLPPARLRYLIENAEPHLVIDDSSLPRNLAKTGPHVLTTDHIESKAKRMKKSAVNDGAQPANAAYIAYTSGSTGRPKGAIITHQATVNHSYDFAQRFQLTTADRVPLMAPIAFDMATEEIIPALISGCMLVVSDSKHTDMAAFTAEIISQGYTVLNIPAPLWHNWTEHLAEHKLAVPPSLRLVIVGSDKIYTKHFLDWKGLEGASRVTWAAAYGATETTVTSTFYTSAWEDDLSQEPVMPIGKPIANTSMYILDESGQPVEIGQAGELHIGGHGLARGYHKLTKTTRERFVPDPFSGGSARMYKTGDQARVRPDGNVVCLGRKDLQVKLNGLRIELGEIESVLSEHPAVDETVVILDQTDQRESAKRLVAFVTLRSKADFTPEDLHAFAAERLHRHMVPKQFVRLDRLPQSSTGKLDRKALERYTNVNERNTYV